MSEYVPQDWKNPNDYPSEQQAKEASSDLWAWAFLARNVQFQKDVTEAEKEESFADDGQGGLVGWKQTPFGKVLNNWGVKMPVPPEFMKQAGLDSPVRFHAPPAFAKTVEINGRYYRLAQASESRVVLEFDLASPLAPQLTKAKKILNASKERIKESLPAENRKQVAMYPLYLRVLDAKAAKATKAKMAEVFSLERPGGVTEKDISNWLNAAEALVNGAYKQIAKL